MSEVQLITDSTCDLSPELLQKHDIDVLPLYVNFEEESFQDNVDMTTPEMYRKVQELGIVPKTAAASPGDFESVFKKHLEAGKHIVYAGIGSKFSATLQNAMIAKQNLNANNIHLVDSENLSSGSGLLMLKAAKFRDAGDDAKTIAKKMRDLTPKVRTQFVIDTLEYLHKGGRLKAISRLVGSMLRIKPIIKVVDGEMAIGKKARGKTQAGIKLMVRDALKDQGNIDEDFFMITHSEADQHVDYIRGRIEEELGHNNIVETQAGCVISSHCGPGTIGILYIVKE